MRKYVDVRCHVTPVFKHKNKRIAFDRNVSVNKLLNEILCREFQEQTEHETAHTLKQELNDVLTRLSNSADLPPQDRDKLKRRKNEIKALLQKGE